MHSVAAGFVVGLAVTVAAGTARAQNAEPPPDTSPPLETPAPPAAPPPAVEAPPPATPPPPAATSPTTDHDQSVGAWGFQLTTAPPFEPLGGVTIPMVGVRRWRTRESGWEAGAAFIFDQQGADPEPSTTIFGASFGYLRTIGVYEHMSVFWEPQGTLLVVVPNDGVDGTDDPLQLLMSGRFSIGTEVRLGWVGLPLLGMTARIAVGLDVVNNGSDTDFNIGSRGGQANSVSGLLTTDIGFVWYAP